jgi:hypothetical protein
MKSWIRERLTYANVVASLALFVALGGTSYALTLPRNSVGPKQLRADAVGRSELRKGAVTSAGIRNRSIRSGDLSSRARDGLRGPAGPSGPAGPPGPTFRAAVSAVGQLVRGNAQGTSPAGAGARLIAFGVPVDACVATASLATVPGEGNPVPPPLGHITTEPGSGGRVLVRTYNPDGRPAPLPFHLVVAC